MASRSLNKLSKVGIYVTHKAWNKMERIVQKSGNTQGFLFSASSGGCNGFNFNLDLLDKVTYHKITAHKPMILQNNSYGVKLYVDPLSEMYLLGTTIDHVSEDYSKGQFENKFIFTVDPKLASSCGCGTSFTPKSIIPSNGS